MHAFEAAADPAQYPDAGEPWEVQKIYYNQTFTKARTTALHEAMLAHGLESPYGEWLKNWEDHEERVVNTHVPCGDYFEVRDKALLAHATQVDPDGAWFRCPLDVQRDVWPTEDFELGRSRIATTPTEDDLFAGIRGTELAR
jgi:mycothiol S-conjugate amidase